MIRRQGPWRNLDDVEYATLEREARYGINSRRLVQPLGDLPTREYEAQYCTAQTTSVGVGVLN